jgi:hypothetical protein
VAIPERLEPPTLRLGNECSILLSYGTPRAQYNLAGGEGEWVFAGLGALAFGGILGDDAGEFEDNVLSGDLDFLDCHLIMARAS